MVVTLLAQHREVCCLVSCRVTGRSMHPGSEPIEYLVKIYLLRPVELLMRVWEHVGTCDEAVLRWRNFGPGAHACVERYNCRLQSMTCFLSVAGRACRLCFADPNEACGSKARDFVRD